MSDVNLFGITPAEVAAAGTEFIGDSKRRRNLLMRLAREECDNVLRPLVRAEIERLAPTYAAETVANAFAAIQRGGGFTSYDLKTAAERMIARAMDKMDATFTVKP